MPPIVAIVFTALLTFCAEVLAPAAHAQQPQQPPRPQNQAPQGARPARAENQAETAEKQSDLCEIHIDKKYMTLPVGSVATIDLVDAAARFLGRNILYNQHELQGGNQNGSANTFTFQLPLTVDAAGAEELLGELLASKWLAVVPIDTAKNLYEVVGLTGPRGRDVTAGAVWRTSEEILQRPNLKQVVITSVKLEHINAQIATNALRGYFQGGGGPSNQANLAIGSVGSNDGLLLQGFTDQVANAIRILQQCDRPQKPNEQDPQQQQFQALKNQVEALQKEVAELRKALADRK